MSTTEYDRATRRGPVVGPKGERYRGLWFRRRADGSIVYEVKLKDRSDTLDEGTSERQAISEWKILSGESEKGKTVIPNGKARLSDVFDLYIAALDEKVDRERRSFSTLRTAQSNWRLHLGPALGTRPISKITADDFAALWKAMEDKGLSNNAQLTIRSLVNGLYKTAIRKGWVFTNPNTVLDVDEKPQKRNRPGYKPNLIRVDNTVKMIDAVNPLYRNMLIVLAATGLRASELCGLTWHDIDFDERKLYVVLQLQRDRHGKLVRAGLKTQGQRRNTAERTVVLLDLALDALHDQRRAEQAKGYGGDDDFVFTTSARTGAPVLQDNFRNRGVKAAGEKAGLGNVRPHDLRHTTASMFAEAGISIPAAAKMMGHTVETYQATYAHAFEDEQEFQTIRERLAKIGFGARLSLVKEAA
jgi:integrase